MNLGRNKKEIKVENQIEKKEQIKIIQIIRLLAALCIIYTHAGIVGNYGYCGVEIFNVVSGYIIMFSTRKKESKNGFLLKRLIRIVPLYWILSIASYCIIFLFPTLSIMGEAKPEYLIKSLFFFPFINGKGYNVPILNVGWTLNYEIMFYIIFFCAMRINHKWRGLLTVAAITAAVILGKFIEFRLYFFDYYTSSILLEFAWGILAFYIIESLQKYKETLFQKWICFLVGIGCFVYIFLDFPGGGQKPAAFV